MLNGVIKIETLAGVWVPTILDTWANLAIFILLFILFTGFTVKITGGIASAFSCALNLNKLKETDWNISLGSSRNTTLVFLVILFAFVISHHLTVLGHNRNIYQLITFFIIGGGIGLYLIIKGIILTLMDYVNKTVCFKEINRFFRTYLIISLSLILAGEMFIYLVPQIQFNFINLWAKVCCVIPFGFYLYMVTKVFLENKFSLFFYILYICALEILPLVVVIKLFEI